MDCVVFARTGEMEREQWLQVRKNGIGGSDIAAICGLNKYKSPVDIYLYKIGALEQPDVQSEAAYFGSLFEDNVAKEFEKRMGKRVRKKNALLQHKDYPFMLANVDRLVIGERAGLECKTASEYKLKHWEEDKVPQEYILQCQWYMAVTGLSRWYIAVIIGGNKFITKEIHRDEELIDYLIEIGRNFWENHVMKNVPPPVDGSVACTELLNSLYPRSTEGAEISLDEEAYNLISKREQLKCLSKELETQINECENKIKDMLKDNEIGVIKDRKVIWKSCIRTSVDSKVLKLKYPEIYEECIKTSSYRKFDIKEEK